MKRRTVFDRESAAFRRDAQRQFAELNRAVRRLRDNVSGLRSVNAARILRGSRYIRGSRDVPSEFERTGINSLGNVIANGFLSSFGVEGASFSASTSQAASRLFNSWARAQRIR